MAMNIFKYAAKNKLRFPFKGTISVESLFDLSLQDLDTVYKALKKMAKSSEDESLLDVKTKEDEIIKIKLQIVKEIFDDKKAAQEKAQKAEATRAKNQKIAAIIAHKEDEALNNKSVDELKAMLANEDDEDDDVIEG